MRSHPRSLFALLVAFALVAAACGGSADLAKAPAVDAAPSDPAATVEPPVQRSDAANSDDTSADDEAAQAPIAIEDTFVAFGNPDADTVIVVAQGGPIPALDEGEAKAIFSDLDLDDVQVVLPHQAQTLDSDRFVTEDISFEQAKEADTQSTTLIANVVQHHLDQNRAVAVVGISFGAFVVQDLLATQGNVADGYLIQVGRLDMPAEVWEQFAQGRFVGFVDGVEVMDVDADGAGMGGDSDVVDSNMAKLAAGLGHKRYTELLANTDLSNVVYAFGETDEQVGRLTADELAFLDAKGVGVLSIEGGHGDAIDQTLLPGLELLFGGDDAVGSDSATDSDSVSEDIGYLPAEDVLAYIEAFNAAAATSSVTIEETSYPILSTDTRDALTLNIDGGSVQLVVGDDGLEDAVIIWDDRPWIPNAEPDITSVPEELGGEGAVLGLTLSVEANDDSGDTLDVEVNLDINLFGAGNSVVEIVDGYATISGTLGTSTYNQIQNVIDNHPEIDTLVMVNVAGSENDEINVHTARLIRNAGWTTWVPANGDISSGGVDMFVAGAERIIEPGAFVGVHSWAGDDQVGSDFPKDDPAHKSQVEYFTEMMGEEAGTDFYFYTLEAAPPEQIYRMTASEIDLYGLTTDQADALLPSSVVGQPAGYLELATGTYLKLSVASCVITNGDVIAELENAEFGAVELTTEDDSGILTIPALEGFAAVEHEISAAEVLDGNISGIADLDLAGIVDGLDTSAASFSIPCR